MHKLPLSVRLDSIEINKQLNKANYKLGELNGIVRLLPNPKILLNAVTLGEAKDSSEIENIITTYDDLFKEMTLSQGATVQAKEVINYRRALLHGYERIKENGFINTNILSEVQSILEKNKPGIRKLPGTVIKNTKTNEVLFTPPQSEDEIRDYLHNLEQYINYDEMEDLDDLIKMAIIHYQFESIHPFYDGNGRTGRILNILYLNLKQKIDLPILYLSRYIIRNKQEYYKLLSEIQYDAKKIEKFVRFILVGIEETSIFTTNFTMDIIREMENTTKLMKEKLPKIYSKELVETLYFDFYTKNEHFRNALGISRNTATKYLKELESNGFLISEKVGLETIYKNVSLYSLINGW